MEFSGLHYCLFVKVLFVIAHKRLRYLITQLLVCQQLFLIFLNFFLEVRRVLFAATICKFIRIALVCQALFSTFFEFLLRSSSVAVSQRRLIIALCPSCVNYFFKEFSIFILERKKRNLNCRILFSTVWLLHQTY